MLRFSSILVSHFMLDLQEAYQRAKIGLASETSTQTAYILNTPTLIFAPALGSIGAHIDAGTLASTKWEREGLPIY